LAQTFKASGLATATVLAVAAQVGWAGFGELGRVGGERPFGVAEVLEGKRPFLFGDCLAGLAQTWLAKRFGQGNGFAVCGVGWSAKVLGIASGSVGEGRF
jgi:hypothetical protein